MSNSFANGTATDDTKVVVKRTPTKEESSTMTQYWRSYEAIGVQFSKIMESVFSDYLGVEFKAGQDNVIHPFLYFKTGEIADSNDGRIRAYEPIKLDNPANTNIGILATNIASFASRKKKHKITKEGQDILSELVYCNRSKDFNWNSSFEEETNTVWSGGRPYNTERIAAYGFDFVKLLRFIKIGGVDDIDDERKYNILCQRIPCQRYSTTAGIMYNELVCINVYNMEQFNNIATTYSVGIPPQFTMADGNIITSTTSAI